MCESYSRSLLRVSVAQICQALGWDSVQLSACHLLTDVLQRYLQQLGRGCHRYSELCEYRAGDTSASPSLSRRPRGSRSAPGPEMCHLLGLRCPWASPVPANSSHPLGVSSSSANFPPPAGEPVSAPSSTPLTLLGSEVCLALSHCLLFAVSRTIPRMPYTTSYLGPFPPLPANYYN
ncbi:Hypothetical predicted protein [Marmota monax]|uniref:Bromodomain associated domain-containing protein n=1 Tax=Marmota monax TaxID=9995 RepID=A0A5E4ART2_MARMO|nr:hypothetical protein GHT09_007719 [Marmota monax]VTJ60014.1 Hypothetical predicted protein [Marmota monax]